MMFWWLLVHSGLRWQCHPADTISFSITVMVENPKENGERGRGSSEQLPKRVECF
jgi:hypothetical protein